MLVPHKKIFQFVLLSFLLSPLTYSCIKFPPPPPPKQEQLYLYPDLERSSQFNDFGDPTADTAKNKGPEIIYYDPNSPDFCANTRIQQAQRFHENGKKYLKAYLANRQLYYLFYAWYASEDARYMSESVKRCGYKLDRHYFAVKHISRINYYLQENITINMRDKEYRQMGEVFLAEYRSVYPRDLH